jgi:hypothetical protein
MKITESGKSEGVDPRFVLVNQYTKGFWFTVKALADKMPVLCPHVIAPDGSLIFFPSLVLTPQKGDL